MSKLVAENQKPYEPGYYAPKPGPFLRFLRTCVIWQLWKFMKLNWVIIRVVAKGHSH